MQDSYVEIGLSKLVSCPCPDASTLHQIDTGLAPTPAAAQLNPVLQADLN